MKMPGPDGAWRLIGSADDLNGRRGTVYVTFDDDPLHPVAYDGEVVVLTRTPEEQIMARAAGPLG